MTPHDNYGISVPWLMQVVVLSSVEYIGKSGDVYRQAGGGHAADESLSLSAEALTDQNDQLLYCYAMTRVQEQRVHTDACGSTTAGSVYSISRVKIKKMQG